MIAWLLARSIPWRLVGIGLAALAVVAAVYGAYLYVGHLNNTIADLRVQLSQETAGRIAAEKALEQLRLSIGKSQVKLDELQAANQKSQDDWAATLKLIDDLNDCLAPSNTTEPSSSKSTQDAVDRLNRTNADVNRMLEHIGH